MNTPARIRLAVLDWAGTTVDFGSFAPVHAFQQAFAQHLLSLSHEQIRIPMGLRKYEHVVTLLEMPDIRAAYQKVHGRAWTTADARAIYDALAPLQAEACRQTSQLVPGVKDCMAELQGRGIKIGTSTGYPRQIAEIVYAAAREQGYVPDYNVAADDTPQARPAPWMIFRNMQELGVFPPACVVKVGDTIPDIEEGRNAGVWSVGVLSSGNEIGLSFADWQSLPEPERKAREEEVGRQLIAGGAHYVIPTIAELPRLIDHLDSLLETGEKP